MVETQCIAIQRPLATFGKNTQHYNLIENFLPGGDAMHASLPQFATVNFF